MCELCDEKTRKSAIGDMEILASRLDVLASAYRDLAHGSVKPHSDKWIRHQKTASLVIRSLVDDWV